MTDTLQEKVDHLKWAVERRHKNQLLSLELFRLLKRHSRKWQSRKYSTVAQQLVAAAFSLWRAAFLADKTGEREKVYADAVAFLEKIIEDNSISYPQDKAAREWTFNYYIMNARFSLEYIHSRFYDISPEYKYKGRTAKERWDYCHELLTKSVKAFSQHFDS